MDLSERHTGVAVPALRRSRVRGAFTIFLSVVSLLIFTLLAIEVRKHTGGIPAWDWNIIAWMYAMHTPVLTGLSLFLAGMGSIAAMEFVAIV